MFLLDHVGKVDIPMWPSPIPPTTFFSLTILPLSHNSLPHNSLCSLATSKSGIVISFTTRLVHPVKCWVR